MEAYIMKYEPPLERYSVNIRKVVLGQGEGAKEIGGENTFPFHFFEGSIPNPPALALEVLDTQPENWAEWVLEPFQDVVSEPASWAKKCAEVFGAEVLCLRLLSTDPMGRDASPEEAAEITKKVLEGIEVPLIVWGTGAGDKDSQVLV
jgi:acetyl-CoA decarbonylase/synthase complex subunit delta